jgi:hypothetical protein
LGGGAGFYCGRNIPYSEQWPIYDGLRQTASIIFGITGAWAAIAYPAAMTSLLRRRGDLSSEEKGAIKKLLRPMIISTGILAVILSVALFVPVLKRWDWFASYRLVARGVSFALLSMLTFAELWAVIFLLVPLDNAKREIDYIADKRRVLRELRPALRGDDDNE